ncbi:MAG: hypothetical protein Q4B70_17635, partial [Lachnospiraceae bacterium]|nr:hypothetical protein [Lachnospiraceae bacterium]
MERQSQRQSLILQFLQALVICLSGFFLASLIRFGLYINSVSQERKKYQLFYALGMEKGTIKKFSIRNIFTENMLGTILSFFIFFLYQCFQQGRFLTQTADYV